MRNQEPNPPRWAEAVLRSLLRPSDRESISGDLLEEYRAARRPALGALGADAWYLKHVGSVLWHLILPCLAVGTIPMSIIARMTRSSLLAVLGLEYVRTARAKGLLERVVVFKHAMRNAMLPIVTVVGLSVGGLMSGAVLTETVFALPGVGTQLVSAILSRDYAVVQAFTVIIALIFVFVNLIVDFSYVFLDPRIRIQ